MKRILIMVCGLIFLASDAWSAECLKDGEPVTFSGKISRETFPGPPNYESIDNGDMPETNWILTVKTPRCVVAASPESGALYEVAKSATRFQLSFEDAAIYKSHSSLVEKYAKVTGRLFIGHNGHHHTNALISVKEIKESSEAEVISADTSSARSEYKSDWDYQRFYDAVHTCRSSVVFPAAKDYEASGAKSGKNAEELRNEIIAITPLSESIASDGCYCVMNEYAREHSHAEFKNNWESIGTYFEVPRCKEKLVESMKIMKDKERFRALILK